MWPDEMLSKDIGTARTPASVYADAAAVAATLGEAQAAQVLKKQSLAEEKAATATSTLSPRRTSTFSPRRPPTFLPRRPRTFSLRPFDLSVAKVAADAPVAASAFASVSVSAAAHRKPLLSARRRIRSQRCLSGLQRLGHRVRHSLGRHLRLPYRSFAAISNVASNSTTIDSASDFTISVETRAGASSTAAAQFHLR